jgi:copper homeostasis protein
MLEIIASTVEAARNAQAGGATSVEVVRNLSEGGLTPPIDLVKGIRAAVTIRIRVIVRPHSRSFVYTSDEIAAMIDDIAQIKAAGADGIVFGSLREDGTIDLAQTEQIARACGPLELTFHRAIDECRDADATLPHLKGKVQRVLTSGQQPSVWEGRDLIRRWIAEYGDSILFSCGGGIKFDQVEAIARYIRGPEYHMGTGVQTNGVVDVEKVRTVAARIKAAEERKA